MRRDNVHRPASRLMVLVWFLLSASVHAQDFKIRNYSVGYRVFEINSVGNNPLTITHLLKDPGSYKNFIDKLSYNGLYGGGGFQNVRHYYVNIELEKNGQSRFWKKYSLQTGLFITNPLENKGGALENQNYVAAPGDTTLYIDTYSQVHKQQFAGANVGLNRRLRLSSKLVFITGLHLQGSIAFVHYYQQQWDSSTVKQGIRQTKTTKLPDLQAKNFFQWQAMVPFGLELNVYKGQIFIRLEGDIGIIRGRYRPRLNTLEEAHGAGLWFLYKMK